MPFYTYLKHDTFVEVNIPSSLLLHANSSREFKKSSMHKVKKWKQFIFILQHFFFYRGSFHDIAILTHLLYCTFSQGSIALFV